VLRSEAIALAERIITKVQWDLDEEYETEDDYEDAADEFADMILKKVNKDG